MIIRKCSWLLLLLLAIPAAAQQESGSVLAQETAPTPGPMHRQDGPMSKEKVLIRMRHPDVMGMRAEMGQWWKNSEIAKKLQLTDTQISKLDTTFLDHKLKLIDDGAAMQKEDLKLQALLDEDSPDEAQVRTQVDKELAAKGALEREYTMMNLDLRKVLSVAQWHQLKAIRQEREPGGNVFYFRKFRTGGMGGRMMSHGPMMMPTPPDPPDPPDPPGPGSAVPDDMN